ncbi:unnamed protein product [Boreogadus saida]
MPTGSARRRRKQEQCCGHLNSLSAIKYAIVSLYILVLLTIFGLCLAVVGLRVGRSAKLANVPLSPPAD